MSDTFFVPDRRGLLTYADRVEIRVYDRDGNPMDSATLRGSVQIEPTDVNFNGDDRYTVSMTSDVLQIRTPTESGEEPAEPA
jgi:hypothetical protein